MTKGKIFEKADSISSKEELENIIENIFFNDEDIYQVIKIHNINSIKGYLIPFLIKEDPLVIDILNTKNNNKAFIFKYKFDLFVLKIILSDHSIYAEDNVSVTYCQNKNTNLLN